MDLTKSLKDGIIFPGLDLANMPEPDLMDMGKWRMPAAVKFSERHRGYTLVLKIPKKTLTDGGIMLPDSIDKTKGQQICWVMKRASFCDVILNPGDIIITTGHAFSELVFFTNNVRKRSPEHEIDFGVIEASPGCIVLIQATQQNGAPHGDAPTHSETHPDTAHAHS